MDDSVAELTAFSAPSGQPARPGAAATQWTFSSPSDRERPDVQDFIRRGFENAYGSHLAQFMPELMVLRNGPEIAAACGLRRAAADRLFLEIYLDAPVETVIGTASYPSVARTDIIEVGNLVISRPGHAR